MLEALLSDLQLCNSYRYEARARGAVMLLFLHGDHACGRHRRLGFLVMQDQVHMGSLRDFGGNRLIAIPDGFSGQVCDGERSCSS